jgi:hypothetical protein
MSDKDDSSQNLFQIGQLFQRSKYIKKVYNVQGLDGCQVMSNINLIPLGYNYSHLTCSSSCANTLFDEIFQIKKGNNSFKNV